MTFRYKPGLVLFFSMLIITFGGCSLKSTPSTSSFIREDVDLSFVTRIAVLPFENNSKEKFAAERSRNIAVTQVLSLRYFDVIDKGLVDSALAEEAIEKGAAIDLNTLKRLGQKLNVQAFLMGTVDSAGNIRKGSVTFPEISLTLRLVDSRASVVLWQASGYKSGDSMVGRLFGLAPSDDFKVTTKLINELLYTMPGK